MEADLSIGVIWCSQINQVAVMKRLMFLPGSLHYKASKELQFAYAVSDFLSQTAHEPQLRH